MSLQKQPEISEDFNFDSAVRNLSPRCVAYRRDCFCGVLHTTEIISAVCCTPPRFFLRRFFAHRGGFLKLGTVDSAVCCTPWRLPLRCVTQRWVNLCGVWHTADIVSVVCTEIISAVCYTPWRFFEIWNSWLRSVLHTAEMISAVRGMVRGRMLHTVEMISVVFSTPLRYSQWCVAHCTAQKELCDRISQQNQNRLRKYFSLFIRGPYMFES